MRPFAVVSGDHNPIHTDRAVALHRRARNPDRARHVAVGCRAARRHGHRREGPSAARLLRLDRPVPRHGWAGRRGGYPGRPCRAIDGRAQRSWRSRHASVRAGYVGDSTASSPRPRPSTRSRARASSTRAWVWRCVPARRPPARSGTPRTVHPGDARVLDAARRPRQPDQLTRPGCTTGTPTACCILTQFTQVAMATVAAAQVAELREAGAFVDGAIACGHSVGEYTALAASAGSTELEGVLEVVYHRGLEMHEIVPRDERGRSNYRLAAIRPSEAGMSEPSSSISSTRSPEIRARHGEFLQVVNYNLARPRSTRSPERSQRWRRWKHELERRRDAHAAARACSSTCPASMCRSTRACCATESPTSAAARARDPPDKIDPDLYRRAYIPNLVPRLFTLDRASWRRSVATGAVRRARRPSSPTGTRGERHRRELCRIMLLELLAWQFREPGAVDRDAGPAVHAGRRGRRRRRAVRRDRCLASRRPSTGLARQTLQPTRHTRTAPVDGAQPRLRPPGRCSATTPIPRPTSDSPELLRCCHDGPRRCSPESRSGGGRSVDAEPRPGW